MATKKKAVKKLPKVLAPLPEINEVENDIPEIDSPQTMNQKKIALAQSVHAPVIVELVRDVLQNVPLVGNSEWETIRNALIIDTSSTILRDLVDHIDEIKRGKLIGK